MDKLSTKADNIACTGMSIVCLHLVGCCRNVYYTINRSNKDQQDISLLLPKDGRPKLTNKIIDDSNKFKNGFKVVRLDNGEYAYLREKDMILLPYRYDIAFDFNEYGLAMAGKNGFVSWINKNFQYLNLNNELKNDDAFTSQFNEIQAFSLGKTALAEVSSYKDRYYKVGYIDTTGKLKSFIKYDGKIVSNNRMMFFDRSSSFDKNGLAQACYAGEDYTLFAEGFFLTNTDLLNIYKNKGFWKVTIAEAQKKFTKKDERRN